MTTRALPFGIRDRPLRLRLADLSRILLDVDEQIEIGLRTRQPRRVQSDEFDALGDAGLDRILEARGVREHRDAVRLQRDRLVHSREPRSRAALAVDDRHLPAELLAGLFHIDAVEMRDVILLVAGEKDDRLARIGLGRRSRPLPFCLRAGIALVRPPSPGRRRRRRARRGDSAIIAVAASAEPDDPCSISDLSISLTFLLFCLPLFATLVCRAGCVDRALGEGTAAARTNDEPRRQDDAFGRVGSAP